MLGLYRQIPLPGGITVNINDLSKIYYGDFYLVRLEISCDIPATGPAIGGGSAATAAETPGNYVPYRRYLQKMGVPSAEVAAVKQALVADFERNSLPYILSAGFPAKLLASLRAKVQKPVKVYLEKNQ